jgi:hypothetical protein
MRNSVYTFIFVFGYCYLLGQIDRDHHPTMTALAILAFVLAAFTILINSVVGDSDQPQTMRGRLCGLLILFAHLFLSFWVRSTFHHIERPALFSFMPAAIAAIMAAIGENPVKVKGRQKRAPEG